LQPETYAGDADPFHYRTFAQRQSESRATHSKSAAQAEAIGKIARRLRPVQTNELAGAAVAGLSPGLSGFHLLA
ncbi:MAG TPA: hypothetical protein VN673_13960, partial [Clostridia bacterium]|nr:hypothetical protein [Clostridia bacterium]